MTTSAVLGARAPARADRAWWRRVDWVLFGSAVALTAFGAVLIYSATRGRLVAHGLDPQTYLNKHLINMVIGVALAAVVMRWHYRLIRAYTPILYVAAIIGLLVTLTPLGKTINGSHGWIVLPAGFTLEPAEFAKVGLIIAMAMFLSEKGHVAVEPLDRDVGLALLVALVPMALVVLQSDVGTMLMMAMPMLAIVAISGAKARWIYGILITAGLSAYVFVNFHLIKAYQVQRFSAFLQPDQNQQSFGYNTTQARTAIGSGGWLGEGLFHGGQTQGGFVPENQTDFIFSVSGEELGFVGSAALVLILGVLLWRGLRIAIRAQDTFGMLVAAGLVTWLGVQGFENVGMNLGIMPVTGVPLPFVSYGGSSLLSAWIAVGLLLNIHYRTSR